MGENICKKLRNLTIAQGLGIGSPHLVSEPLFRTLRPPNLPCFVAPSPPSLPPPLLLLYPLPASIGEQGMVINEFEGNEAAIFPVPRGMPTTPTDIYEAFLEAYGYGEREDRTDVLLQVVWILLGNLVLFRVLTLACLKYITFERR